MKNETKGFSLAEPQLSDFATLSTTTVLANESSKAKTMPIPSKVDGPPHDFE
jgi:hypothetical protein